ncbi:hypothetical protein HPB48_023065 [Haemaphysalis longicornis]|uniref:AMP-dependent synthetase/ligase domain-containing protein n=1 Tax=Haemaphysalis longicornis TaxID=44386 RepID=A0A9J6H6X7_HAELO|nr:hypothetical protein HPB48_023065 [Haemaphysalis longicornis]
MEAMQLLFNWRKAEIFPPPPPQGLFVTGTCNGFESVSGFAELDGRDYEELAVSEPAETVAALAYTSGTTGLPKGVEISHRSFVANLHTSK